MASNRSPVREISLDILIQLLANLNARIFLNDSLGLGKIELGHLIADPPELDNVS